MNWTVPFLLLAERVQPPDRSNRDSRCIIMCLVCANHTEHGVTKVITIAMTFGGQRSCCKSRARSVEKIGWCAKEEVSSIASYVSLLRHVYVANIFLV